MICTPDPILLGR